MTGNQAGSSTQRTQQDKGQRTVEWSGRQWQRRLRPVLAIGNVAKVLWHTRTHINKHTHTHTQWQQQLPRSLAGKHKAHTQAKHTHTLYTHTHSIHSTATYKYSTHTPHTHSHIYNVCCHALSWAKAPLCPTPPRNVHLQLCFCLFACSVCFNLNKWA